MDQISLISAYHYSVLYRSRTRSSLTKPTTFSKTLPFWLLISLTGNLMLEHRPTSSRSCRQASLCCNYISLDLSRINSA